MNEIPVWGRAPGSSNRRQVGVTIVDSEDYEYLNQWSWHFHTAGYVQRRERNRSILMQRCVAVRWKGEGRHIVRHLDRDKTNNQRCNLIVSTAGVALKTAGLTKIPLLARDGSVREYATVDEEYVDGLLERRWSLDSDGYAITSTHKAGRRVVLRMHRVVLGRDDTPEVDHINGNRLDNRRSNLRPATRVQNAQNHRPGKSYRGTSYNSKRKRWMASVRADGRSKNLGYYKSRDEAAAVAAEFRREHLPYSIEARNAASI